MDERAVVLRNLVIGGHVSVAERRILGLVNRAEVAELLKSYVLSNGIFPPHKESNAVNEGATLLVIPDGFEITWRRAYSSDPFRAAETTTRRYRDIDAAIDAYIGSEWSTGIDGVRLS